MTGELGDFDQLSEKVEAGSAGDEAELDVGLRKFGADGGDQDVHGDAGKIALLLFDENIDGADGYRWSGFDGASDKSAAPMFAGEELFLDEDVHCPMGGGCADAKKEAHIGAAMVSITRAQAASSDVAFNESREMPESRAFGRTDVHFFSLTKFG